MSYQVIARKWRPQGFDDVTGQAHVTTPLRNAIRSDRVPHAILLTGPRGVGKTTIARILARCLNCDKGPTDQPCGECPSCREVAAGTSTDVQEIDAASRTSVDDVRELVAAIRYAAAPGKHRIFVVDEVHMLSTAAFNALLKTLEEPPPNSLFVFATTNPEKIPFTVVSRCQRYDLRRIAAAEIVERLEVVIKAEKVKISKASLLSVAREADGSLRDAQTLLDQLIAYGGSEIDDDQVAEVLDLIDRRLLLRIAAACVDGDAAAALEATAEAGAGGVDAKRLGENLLQLLRDLVVLAIAPEREEIIERSAEEVAELRELAGRTDAVRVRRMFRALVKEQEDLAWAPQPFAVLEMAVVRLATLPSGDDVARLLSRLEALEAQLRRGGAVGGGPAGSEGSGRGGGGKPEPRRRAPEPVEPGRADARGPGPRATSDERPVRTRSEADADDDGPEPVSTGPAPGDGRSGAVLDRLRALARSEEPGLYAALEGGRIDVHEDDKLRLVVPEGFAAGRLRDKATQLDALATRFFGRETQVHVESASRDNPETPGGIDPQVALERRQAALNDPGVGRALEIMGGEIVEIRPLGGGR